MIEEVVRNGSGTVLFFYRYFESYAEQTGKFLVSKNRLCHGFRWLCWIVRRISDVKRFVPEGIPVFRFCLTSRDCLCSTGRNSNRGF